MQNHETWRYARSDFSESLDRLRHRLLAHNYTDLVPRRVLLAYGTSPEDYASWRGGFIFEADVWVNHVPPAHAKIILLTGWCDTSGWGCQDGIEYSVFDNMNELLRTESMRRLGASGMEVGDLPPLSNWDKNPPDLNEWVTNGCRSDDQW